MLSSNTDQACCMLNLTADTEQVRLSRYLPAPDLRFFVERYWIATWSVLGSAPYYPENLPHPCVNLVVGQGQSNIFGVVRGKFSHPLHQHGLVFGIKFNPGAFYPFVNSPVSALTDATIRCRDIFGVESSALEAMINHSADHGTMITRVEQFLRGRLPEADSYVALSTQIVETISRDRAIRRVDDIAARFSLSKRTLYRIFSQYVGVSPKWVIRCYRLQEALQQIVAGMVDWPRLAVDLGYFDQAHFINDFKAIVGKTPGEYATDRRAAQQAAGADAALRRARSELF
jgi:AraC-like DNA-binding protein